MLGGGTSSCVFVGEQGVRYILVEEVRVEGDHLIQLSGNSNIYDEDKCSLSSYLQELVDLPGCGRTRSKEEQSKRGGGR